MVIEMLYHMELMLHFIIILFLWAYKLLGFIVAFLLFVCLFSLPYHIYLPDTPPQALQTCSYLPFCFYVTCVSLCSSTIIDARKHFFKKNENIQVCIYNNQPTHQQLLPKNKTKAHLPPPPSHHPSTTTPRRREWEKNKCPVWVRTQCLALRSGGVGSQH